MITPENLGYLLQKHLNAESCSHSQSDRKGVKSFVYELEVTDYRTFTFLKNQVEHAEDNADVDLIVEGIKPTIHQTDSKIEARITIEIKENFNRRAEENRSLEDYE